MLKKRRFSKENVVKVTFSLPADVAHDSVRLVAEFNDWEGTSLEKQKDGSWKTTVALSPGREYEFRYLVDEAHWMNEPAADRYVANPFGDDNSVIST